jgi:FkbM family methyltransferase
MLVFIKIIINRFFTLFGFVVIKQSNFNNYQDYHRKMLQLKLLSLVKDDSIRESITTRLDEYNSQFAQDIFLNIVFQHYNGFFVEFGATDGIINSNTLFFERYLKWNGILSEPGKYWHDSLRRNRLCNISYDAVSNSSGLKLTFSESLNPETSHLGHSWLNKTYKVNTISLNDLLKTKNAPKEIDFIVIDTEGNEYEILKNFEMNEWGVKVYIIEMNFDLKKQEKITKLFSQSNYTKVLSNISHVDSWYVREDILNNLKNKLHEV